MAEYLVQDTTLTAIADAVRAKKGTTEPIALTDLAAEIESIQSGGGSASNKLAFVVGKQSTNNLYEITEEDLSGITEIRYAGFFTCSGLTSITIPDSVTSIGISSFQDCTRLASIIIPDSVTSIGANAFYGCSSLTSAEISDNVTSIDDNTFEGCSRLTSITIPSRVISIGYGAFFGCSRLASITIPSSVTNIGDLAFFGCRSLTNITMESQIPPTITSETFPDTVQTYTVQVGCGEAYRAADVWANYSSKIVEATE